MDKVAGLWNKCQKNGKRHIEAYRKIKECSNEKIFMNLLGDNNSKVQCLTFGTPAKLACTPVLGENSICSICYAQSGRYSYPNVMFAQIRRLYAFLSDTDRFIASCINQINSSKHKYVRMHDSGDFFSIEYTKAWYEIIKECDKKKFFAPTRKYLDKDILKQLIQLNSLSNVTIRPSALFINEESPMIKGLSGGTSVNSNFGTCQATVNHTSCVEENCRKCWNSNCKNIVFKKH